MTTPATLPTAPALYPLPFVVASWLGYPIERLVAGLREGTIAPPLGAPDGWLPPGYVDASDSANDDDAGDAADDIDDPGDGGDDSGPFPPDFGAPPDDSGDVDVPADTGEPPPARFDRDSARELLGAIDPTLDDARFDAWWTAFGADDTARARGAEAFLFRQILGAEPPPDGPDSGPHGGGTLAAAIARHAPHGTLVSFAELGSAAIASLARRDAGALAALAALDDHALVALEGGVARPGRFDANTGERRVADSWIDDRARYLAWTIAGREGADLAQAPGEGWRFIDRTGPAVVTLDVGAADGAWNQVVFARDGGDRVDGGGASDRLHGGDGDDLLRGAGGADLIEGGGGDDRIAGGIGGDGLVGGTGDDDLAGGIGDDTLDGGSGDDWLEGGRGADRLEGGAGHDVYDYSSGDGHDLVVDADGAGEIRWDGIVLTGDADVEAAEDPDGETPGVRYSLLDDGAGGSTLVIRGAESAGRPQAGEIRVRDWRQGDLGIRLADPAAGATPAMVSDDDPPEGADSSVPDEDADDSADAGGNGAAHPTLGPLLRLDPFREPGNESGWGTIDPGVRDVPAPTAAQDDPASDDTVAPDPVDADADAGAPVDAGDWARAFAGRPPAGDRHLPEPPDVDAGAVTLADLGLALAVHADDDALDASGVATPSSRLPVPDDSWALAIAPPEAPPRAPH